jgi:hypothetical protein
MQYLRNVQLTAVQGKHCITNIESWRHCSRDFRPGNFSGWRPCATGQNHHEMLGVLIFLLMAAAPAAGSVLSLQIMHVHMQSSLIKGPRILLSNTLLRQNVDLAQVARGAATIIQPELLLRLRGGKKGTASQGKRGTGHKAHPSYKYNLRQVDVNWQIMFSKILTVAFPQLSAKEQSRWNYLEALYPQEKSAGF